MRAQMVVWELAEAKRNTQIYKREGWQGSGETNEGAALHKMEKKRKKNKDMKSEAEHDKRW